MKNVRDRYHAVKELMSKANALSSMENNSHVRTTSLSRGKHTFTPERLASILRNERFSYKHRPHPNALTDQDVVFGPTEIRYETDIGYFKFEKMEDECLRCYHHDQARLRSMEFGRRLYDHDGPVSIAVTDLDGAFSKDFRFKFEPLKESRALAEQACNLLERMPAYSLELVDTDSYSVGTLCV